MEAPINNYAELEEYIKKQLDVRCRGRINIVLEEKWFFFLIRLIKFSLYGVKEQVKSKRVKSFLVTINKVDCKIIKG